MISRLFKLRPTQSSPFSEFIRTASSAQKKRVYREVLKKATERQNRLVKSVAHAEPGLAGPKRGQVEPDPV